MTQQPHCWVYIQGKWNQCVQETPEASVLCDTVYNSQEAGVTCVIDHWMDRDNAAMISSLTEQAEFPSHMTSFFISGDWVTLYTSSSNLRCVSKRARNPRLLTATFGDGGWP
jgi:hypothetical protein